MKLYTAVGAFIVAVFVVVAVFNSTSSTPTNLAGTWQSNSPSMVAHISGNQIEIDDVGDNNTTSLYWKGTFNPTGGTQTSQGDTHAMGNALLASTLKTKQFTYKDGKLSYKMSILGMTTTVYLKR